MSGYSTTPQAKKLGLKPGARVALVAADPGWALDEPQPDGLVELEAGDPAAPADVVIAFARAAAEVPTLIDAHGQRIRPAGALWLAWPRRAAGHVSDVTDSVVREAALAVGLVDVKVAALDEDWSALKLVWRVENR